MGSQDETIIPLAKCHEELDRMVKCWNADNLIGVACCLAELKKHLAGVQERVVEAAEAAEADDDERVFRTVVGHVFLGRSYQPGSVPPAP